MAVLKKMGFGNSFCRWLKTFYSNLISSVIVNHFIWSSFPLSREFVGVVFCLLCCMSCLLRSWPLTSVSNLQFVLSVSPSLHIVHMCLNMPTILVLSLIPCPRCNFYFKSMGCMRRLRRLSLTLITVLGFGLVPGGADLTLPGGLKRSSSSANSPGIFIGNDDLSHDNFDPRILKLANELSSWKQRRLSLSGKSFIVSSLALSGLYYTITSCPVPDWVIKKVSSLIWPFLGIIRIWFPARHVCCQNPREAFVFLTSQSAL